MSSNRVVFTESPHVIDKCPPGLCKFITMESLLTSLINGRIDKDSRDMKEDIVGFVSVLLDKLGTLVVRCQEETTQMAWAFLGAA